MSVRIDGIHPARRIGKMILKRSKRSSVRFVIGSPNRMPASRKLALSRLTCCSLQARANVTTKKRVLSQRGETSSRPCHGDWQTSRPGNYEDERETVVYQHDVTAVFTCKPAIFGLTRPVKTASCRPYCLNDWRP